MRRLLASILMLLWCGASLSAADWSLYQLHGRDYVTMENVAQFYGLKNIERSEKETTMSSGVRSLRGTLNSQEFFINNLKFILSYPLEEHEGHVCLSRMDLVKLIEPVMRPSRIKGAEVINTVILDAGHGGHDRGATSMHGAEKDYTLDVVLRAKTLFEAAGYKVVLTRDGDYFVPLDDRTRIANNHKKALFISIHFNSGGAGTGVETYTLAPRGVPSMMSDGPAVTDFVECAGNVCDAENIALATASHAALVVKTRMFDRGLKRARFVVIRDVAIPGVLIEGGFLSNPDDAKIIATPGYRQVLAQAVVQAVANYRKAVGPQTAPPPVAAPAEYKKPTPRPVSSPAPIEPPESKPGG